MACVATMPRAQLYDIVMSFIDVDNAVYCEYGILQNCINEDGRLVQVRIDGISTDKEIVDNLISILEKEEVSPSTLQDIVEDYIGELYTI